MSEGMDDVQVLTGDLSNLQANLLVAAGTIACDIETTGLDWRSDRIASCQLHFPGGPIFVVRTRDGVPSELCRVLSSQKVRKVFHHAMFDLRFINHHWEHRSNERCMYPNRRKADRSGESTESLAQGHP